MTGRRPLSWEGCVNVRDLGGHPTDGGETAYGAVVRSDCVGYLTDAGWEGLAAHGVRTIVDLRFPEERAQDPPRDVTVEAIHISVLGSFDPGYAATLDERLGAIADEVVRIRESYLEFLERNRAAFAEVVAAVADAADGAVVVHCQEGKDRTGLVAALLLRLAGVAPALVAADYAESEVNLRERLDAWIAEAPDRAQRERRRRVSTTPRDAMVQVLAELERRYGGVAGYLRAGGASEPELERAKARLLGARVAAA